MTEHSPDKPSESRISRLPAKENVLQVERRDYVDLAPNDRPRVQSLNGFDDIYTDIVDYIVRCTHRIWDERNIGLIYTHYTHNCTVYGTMARSITARTWFWIPSSALWPSPNGAAWQRRWCGPETMWMDFTHPILSRAPDAIHNLAPMVIRRGAASSRALSLTA